jgi:iron complex transport system substrate-binding protein
MVIKMKNIYILLVAIIYVIASVGCPQQKNKESIRKIDIISDATGEFFALPIMNYRIISLAPSITENIKILKAENQLVGRTDFCKVANNIISVGTILEPSIEKIVDLKPDLVLATREGNRLQTVERLRELQVPIFVFGESNSWDDVQRDFLLCGRLFDKEREAEKILESIKYELSRISTAQNTIAHLPRVFIQLNITPLMTAGNGTFINEIIKFSHGDNIAKDSKVPWPILNVEDIIKKNPEIIIISGMDTVTTMAKEMWLESRFADIDAVRDKKIYEIESDLLCQPTPINFIIAIRKIREYLK